MPDYALQPYRWGDTGAGSSPVVTWSFATTNYSGQQYSYDGFLTGRYQAEVRLAFERWESIANIDFVEVGDNSGNDIRLGLDNIDGQGRILGESWTSYDHRTGFALVSEIRFEQNEGWRLLNGSLVSAGGSSFYGLALHEIGHSIGLGHYDGAPAIMNSYLTLADLTVSDVHGVQALYGSAGEDQLDVSEATSFGGADATVFFQNVGGSVSRDVVQLHRGGEAHVWLSTGSAFSRSSTWVEGATSSDQLVDLNGDGRSDLLQFYNGRHYAALSNGSAFSAWSQWNNSGTASDRAADLNGDGRADLMQIYAGREYVSLSAGSGFGPWNDWGGGATSADQLIDLNGDGRADLLQFHAGREYVALSSGSGFGAWSVWGSGATATDRVVDVSGDGLLDIVQLYNGRTYVATSNGSSFNSWSIWLSSGGTSSDHLIDVNGDSRADLVQFYNGRAHVALSNGSGFSAYSPWGGSGYLNTDMPVDVSGDGRADIIQFYDGRAYVALSTGTGFSSFSNWGNAVTSSADSTFLSDSLHEGFGDDRPVFGQNEGKDTIRDYAAGSNNADAIAMFGATDETTAAQVEFDVQNSTFLQDVYRSQLSISDFILF